MMATNPSTGFPLPLQFLLWGAANSIAGAAVGLAVGVFREGGFEPTMMLISVLFGNVVGFTVLGSSVILAPRLREHGPIVRSAMLGLALLSGSVAGTALVRSAKATGMASRTAAAPRVKISMLGSSSLDGRSSGK